MQQMAELGPEMAMSGPEMAMMGPEMNRLGPEMAKLEPEMACMGFSLFSFQTVFHFMCLSLNKQLH